MQHQSSTLEQIKYQNQTLYITLISADFNNLQKIEHELKQSGLKVKQTQAATQKQQVIATLELM